MRFELAHFERVDASPTTALLRVSGTWAPEPPDPPPTLLAADGAFSRRIAPLPDPAGAAAQPWRAAYPVPTSMLETPGIWFALVSGDGPSVALPSLDEARLEAELDEARHEIAQLVVRAERAEMRAGGADRRSEARAKLRSAEARRDAAESRAARLEELLAEAQRSVPAGRASRSTADASELEAELARVRRRADELTERLTATQRELAEATERYRTEADARQRAEARAGSGDGPATDGGDSAGETDELRGRLTAIERENAALRDRLVEERRTTEETAERYREEVEARMKAEGRARTAELGHGPTAP